MSDDLRDTIEQLASTFAASVINALTGASIDEISSVKSGGGGAAAKRGPGRPPAAAKVKAVKAAAAPKAKKKSAAAPAAKKKAHAKPKSSGSGAGGKKKRTRRSAAALGKMVDSIVAALHKHPSGLRAEQIRDAIDAQSKDLPRPIADALAAGRITKKGEKRATTYFAAGGGVGAKKKASAKK